MAVGRPSHSSGLALSCLSDPLGIFSYPLSGYAYRITVRRNIVLVSAGSVVATVAVLAGAVGVARQGQHGVEQVAVALLPVFGRFLADRAGVLDVFVVGGNQLGVAELEDEVGTVLAVDEDVHGRVSGLGSAGWGAEALIRSVISLCRSMAWR